MPRKQKTILRPIAIRLLRVLLNQELALIIMRKEALMNSAIADVMYPSAPY